MKLCQKSQNKNIKNLKTEISDRQNKITKRKMLRKNQLKRLTLEKLHDYAKSTTNGQMITMANEVIIERNDLLKEKSKQLKAQIQRVRKQTRKTIKQMNEAVKERLNKKEKIIMDKNSRPTPEDIKNLAQLYTYMQNQTSLIDKNNKNLSDFHQQKTHYLTHLDSCFTNPQQQFSTLDTQHLHLSAQCLAQESKLTGKKRQLDQFRSHVENINRTIEEYRVKYEEVESVIRQRERELDHLVTYMRTRRQEDQDNIERERRLGDVIQSELLRSQSIYNANQSTNENFMVLEIENSSSKAAVA